MHDSYAVKNSEPASRAVVSPSNHVVLQDSEAEADSCPDMEMCASFIHVHTLDGTDGVYIRMTETL